MATLKYSRQRECIREYVRNCREHPTADSIYGKMKDEFPNISLGTVYRNLSLLVELGEITKISIDNGALTGLIAIPTLTAILSAHTVIVFKT